MTAKPNLTKRETLNIRIKTEERGLIDRAAHLRGQKRTDFTLRLRAAEDALLDRTLITASPEAFREFVKRLDAEPKPQCAAAQDDAGRAALGEGMTLSAPQPWKPNTKRAVSAYRTRT
jgi:uncharacterized protein (DUF1778 family)